MANEVVIHVKTEGHPDRDMDVVAKKTEVAAKRSFLRSGGHAGAAFMAGFIKTITLGQVGSGFAMAATRMAPQMAHLGGALGVTLAAALVVKLASAVSALLPAALGAGMLAGPLIYLWKNQEKAVDRLKKKAKGFMDEISRPLKVPFLESLKTVGDQLDKWAPKVKDAFKDLGPALKPLTKGALGAVGDFFSEIGKKLPSITAALEEWGKKLPKIGRALGKALGNWMGDADETKASVDDLTDSLVALLDAVGAVGKGFRKFGKMNDGFKELMEGQRKGILEWRMEMLKSLSTVADNWAKSPLAPKWAKKWAKGLHEAMDSTQKDLDNTKKKLNEVANQKVKTKVEANISDLEAKIRTAKKRLRETHNQKTRSKIEADIRQLQARVAAAKAALRGVKDRKVIISAVLSKGFDYAVARARQIAGRGIPARATGGITSAATGGERGNQVLVGEEGPEIVDLPVGSHVNSNADSRRMASGGGGSGGGVHFHFHGPVYGDHNALKRALVNMKRAGDLDLVLR